MSQDTITSMNNNFKGFLLIAVLNLMAAINWSNWFTYALNAITGGIIWIAFKVLSDIITEYRHHRKRKTKKNDQG
jgi:hypothetical protein